MSSDEVTQLRTEVDRLMRRLSDLERASGLVDDSPDDSEHETSMEPDGVSRRQWVRAAAAAAVGGTAAVVAGTRPVAAASGDPLVLGQTNTSGIRTRADYTGGSGGVGHLFQSGSVFSLNTAAYPAALAGYTTAENQPNGIYGFTSVPSDADTGASAVVGFANGANSTGVRAESTTGTAVRATGGRYGVETSGDTAAMVLIPTDFRQPTELTDFHAGGELYVRAASDSGLAVELWFCVVGGEPGVWTQIAGPSLPGTFRSVTPTRVYDSRSPSPQPGVLAAGSNRIVDLDVARNLTTGAGIGTAIPEGANAIAFNLAIVNTSGSGFLSVTPSFETAVGAATINWSQSGQILNNGSIVGIGTDRKVKVFAGGSGSTNFILDVTGYWI
jgi:hypothetical protein